ncbi:MAG: fused MFS/spermidine synthase [Planctomycetota bacterium]
MLRTVAFLLFVASGFCGLLYQVVWLRLAFANFGIVTPVLSVLISVFMLGLALGSWLGGRAGSALVGRSAGAAAVGYGLAEFGIGVGALVVPWAFDLGAEWLHGQGEASSASYLGMSAIVITASILLFTTLMGATFPLMMAFLRARTDGDEGTFSFLYLGNVIGAMAGALVTALVLIELLGFRSTLLVAAGANVAIGLVALAMPLLFRKKASGVRVGPVCKLEPEPEELAARQKGRRFRLLLLFVTGFTSMAMEVVWTRAFTPVLKTTIYAFAAVLTVYLLATWLGSAMYRVHLRKRRVASVPTLLALLFVGALLPLVCNDPRAHESSIIVLLSLVPISLLLGYMTPQLIDEHSRGEPGAAGSAYAVNVFGCILGPLLSGYVLLPTIGVKWSLLLLAMVYPVFLLVAAGSGFRFRATSWLCSAAGIAALVIGISWASTHEDPQHYESAVVRRDSTASVVASFDGNKKRLLVNGVGITTLTPVTAVMAHLPLVLREQPPESTLVICFGMGSTFRSLASWGGRTTAVELVPSVVDSFGYFFDDAGEVMARPGTRAVIDDGRRFLSRTDELFDAITIDPPPPVEAGGSSLLYSREFYEVLKPRLSETGVLQQWFPGGEIGIARAVANTLSKSFPHVTIFRSFEPPHVGLHMIASKQPLAVPTPAEALSRMPEAARANLSEWTYGVPLEMAWKFVLDQLVPIETMLPEDRELVITDDRPFNEYFWLRRTFFGAGDGRGGGE